MANNITFVQQYLPLAYYNVKLSSQALEKTEVIIKKHHFNKLLILIYDVILMTS